MMLAMVSKPAELVDTRAKAKANANAHIRENKTVYKTENMTENKLVKRENKTVNYVAT